MLVVEIELLGGRYVATEYNDRQSAEWPPHPARFYSALVAALHDREPTDPAERAALLWLEHQEAPQLAVDLSVTSGVGRRAVRSLFVPVNDISTLGREEELVRKARSELRSLSEGAEPDQKARSKAEEALVKAEGKLQKFLDSVDETPAQSVLATAHALLPPHRTRQERTMPVVVPARSTFAFVWPSADVSEHRAALESLCARVTRLGHSSSLVRCAVSARAMEPTLVPRHDGDLTLRVVGPGQLDRLETAYTQHQALEARVLPARPQPYGVPEESLPPGPRSVFGSDWLVFERIGGDRPLASRGSDLAAALRGALIETNGREDLPVVLSGHEVDGAPGKVPHLAIVPLPWVDHEHADASIQGIALLLPRSARPSERDQLHRVLAMFEQSRGDADDDYAVELGAVSALGGPLRVRLRRVDVSAKTTLTPGRWCRAARRFITATPIALDRYPGNLRSNAGRTAQRAAREAEESIATACEQIGLPRPLEVSISLAPLLTGVQHVRHYTPWPSRPGRPARARVHAEIVFKDFVRGPLLLGAGRYFGLGLCLPVAGAREVGA